MNRADVASQIIGSNEFFQRQGATNTTFIVAAYEDVLARAPTIGEINFWLK